MPVSGTRDASAGLETAPEVTPAEEAVVLARAEMLQLTYEIDSAAMRELLPPALHPVDPPMVTFVAVRARASALGDFTIVSTRIACRAGVRPRGFVLDAYVDDPGAGATLSRSWGFPATPGRTLLERRYHDVVMEVEAGGRTILRGSLVDPEPMSGAEIQLIASMHSARVQRDGQWQPRLVQVDPELTFHQAARGRPRLDAFEASAWGDERLRPVYPVSAWFAVGDLELPRVRYLCDPAVGALEGTEKV